MRCYLKLLVNKWTPLAHVFLHVCGCLFAAERFGTKLEELCRERSSLELGLPSQQPSVALFLERLRQAVHSALQRGDCGQRRSVTVIPH